MLGPKQLDPLQVVNVLESDTFSSVQTEQWHPIAKIVIILLKLFNTSKTFVAAWKINLVKSF